MSETPLTEEAADMASTIASKASDVLSYGSKVWGKWGKTWWPAEICDPEKVETKCPRPKHGAALIMWYGTHDFGVVPHKSLLNLEESKKKCTPKKVSKQLSNAIAEAEEPVLYAEKLFPKVPTPPPSASRRPSKKRKVVEVDESIDINSIDDADVERYAGDDDAIIDLFDDKPTSEADDHDEMDDASEEQNEAEHSDRDETAEMEVDEPTDGEAEEEDKNDDKDKAWEPGAPQDEQASAPKTTPRSQTSRQRTSSLVDDDDDDDDDTPDAKPVGVGVGVGVVKKVQNIGDADGTEDKDEVDQDAAEEAARLEIEKEKERKKQQKKEQKRLEKLEAKKREKEAEKARVKAAAAAETPKAKLKRLSVALKNCLITGREDFDKAVEVLNSLGAVDAKKDLLLELSDSTVSVVKRCRKHPNDRVKGQAKQVYGKWKDICVGNQ